MARTQFSPQIRGLPRKKRSPPQRLKEDIKRKSRILRLEAPLAIIGIPGSGRKTLAYRFANMNTGVIQEGEVPVEYFYTAYLGGRFSDFFTDLYETFSIRIRSFIIDPPAELPTQYPPLYWEYWNRFRCLIFAFDVRNQASFLETTLRLSLYRMGTDRLRACFLVGNKSDTRQESPVNPEDPDRRPVQEFTASMEAEHHHARYYECSAKNSMGVPNLLIHIKHLILNRRYWSTYDI